MNGVGVLFMLLRELVNKFFCCQIHKYFFGPAGINNLVMRQAEQEQLDAKYRDGKK